MLPSVSIKSAHCASVDQQRLHHQSRHQLLLNSLLATCLRRNVAMERIVCIISDGILNMGTCLVLPLIVFLPYVYAFDPEDYVFPMEILYGDIEFTNFVMENQFVLTTSCVDGLAKIVSHCAIFTGFPAIRSLVRCTPPSSTSLTPSDTRKSTVSIRSAQPLGYRLIHAVFILGGVAVLLLHIHASLVSSSFQAELACLQIMRPWFASRQPCAIYLVDCKHTGEDSPAPEVLDGLDELVLLNIYFMNCPQLQVPTSIQRFPNLIGVEVHNSTFAQWSVDAAIRAHLHPRMMYLIMVRVNMTGLPDGVLQPLPPLLTDIELIHTNLTALPDDLDERWPNMALLFFEYGQIHEFPPVLLKMPIYELSLIGNRIEELPSLKAEYNVLSMARNPVTKLPETIDKDAYVAFFSLHGAKVETLPRWVATHVKEELYLMGTPFCAALEDGQSDLQQWHGSSVVKCNEPDPRASGRYPLELVDAMRSGSA